MTTAPYTAAERALARSLWIYAGDDAIVPAVHMRHVAPDRPELHVPTKMQDAFLALTGKEYKPEFLIR